MLNFTVHVEIANCVLEDNISFRPPGRDVKVVVIWRVASHAYCHARLVTC